MKKPKRISINCSDETRRLLKEESLRTNQTLYETINRITQESLVNAAQSATQRQLQQQQKKLKLNLQKRLQQAASLAIAEVMKDE